MKIRMRAWMSKGLKRKSTLFAATSMVLLFTATLLQTSCMPTYPQEKLPDAIKEVCKTEYDMTVDVAIKGSTLGIYYPMQGLMDVSMGISEAAWDKISNLILVASRVVLSTDADIKFYCVITQDERLPELQVVIIKYVDDVKMGMYRNISRSESFKRTLFSVNLTPQARKERSVEQIFDRLGLEEGTRENVLDEFFRSTPSRLSDIGYWRGHFYLKDISLGEFLASQISNRMKIDFRGEKSLSENFNYKSSEGEYIQGEEENSLLVKFKIFDQKKKESEGDLRELKIGEILRIVKEVVNGYKFKDFSFLEMEDQILNAKLLVSAGDVETFNKKKIAVEEIVKVQNNYF
jgi:hypothetical protein